MLKLVEICSIDRILNVFKKDFHKSAKEALIYVLTAHFGRFSPSKLKILVTNIYASYTQWREPLSKFKFKTVTASDMATEKSSIHVVFFVLILAVVSHLSRSLFLALLNSFQLYFECL